MMKLIKTFPLIAAAFIFTACLDRTAAFVGEYEYEGDSEYLFQTNEGVIRSGGPIEGEVEIRDGKKSDMRLSIDAFEDCDDLEFDAVNFQTAELARSMSCSTSDGTYDIAILVDEGSVEVDDDEVELEVSGKIIYGGVPGTFELRLQMERND